MFKCVTMAWLRNSINSIRNSDLCEVYKKGMSPNF